IAAHPRRCVGCEIAGKDFLQDGISVIGHGSLRHRVCAKTSRIRRKRYAEIVRPRLGKFCVALETEEKPAADIVATDPASLGDLVVTAAAAQIAGPAAIARFHPVDMAALEVLAATQGI